MPQPTKRFRCEILTPTGTIEQGDVVSVVVPAADGQFGVLAEHSPVLMAIGAGPLSVKLADGAERNYFASGGFAACREDTITILLEKCEPVENMDMEAAQKEMDRIRQSAPAGAQDRARRTEELFAATRKLTVAGARRAKNHKGGSAAGPAGRQ